jgi:hypothetical protein
MYRRWVYWIQAFSSDRSTKVLLSVSILSTITLKNSENFLNPNSQISLRNSPQSPFALFRRQLIKRFGLVLAQKRLMVVL